MRRFSLALIIAIVPFTTSAASSVFIPASPFSLMAESHMTLWKWLGSPFAEVSIFARTMRHASPHVTLAPSPIPGDTEVNPAASPLAPATASVSMVADPREIDPGQSTTISWSSVGMSAGAPCELSEAHVIATGNTGSIRVTLRAREVHTFRLVCASDRGESIVKSLTVSVR